MGRLRQDPALRYASAVLPASHAAACFRSLRCWSDRMDTLRPLRCSSRANRSDAHRQLSARLASAVVRPRHSGIRPPAHAQLQLSRPGSHHPRAYPVALPTTLHLEGAAALPTTLPREGAAALPLGSRPPALPDHIHPCAAERAPRRAARASDLQRTHRGGARRTRTQKRHGGRRGEHGRKRERSLGCRPTRCGHGKNSPKR